MVWIRFSSYFFSFSGFEFVTSELLYTFEICFGIGDVCVGLTCARATGEVREGGEGGKEEGRVGKGREGGRRRGGRGGGGILSIEKVCNTV